MRFKKGEQIKMEEHNKDCPMHSLMSMLEKLVERPDIDSAIIAKLIDANEVNMERKAKVEYNTAMMNAQTAMPVIPEDRKNNQTNSTYASYENVLKYAKPVYTEEGFSLVFSESETDKPDNIRICVDILHQSGHSETRWTDIPIDDKGIQGKINKTPTHAKGSSISYGKGYLIKMVFNIPTGDDDNGNAAGGTLPLVTKAQIKSIDQLRKKAKILLPDFKNRLMARFDVKSTKALTSDHATELIKNLSSMTQ